MRPATFDRAPATQRLQKSGGELEEGRDQEHKQACERIRARISSMFQSGIRETNGILSKRDADEYIEMVVKDAKDPQTAHQWLQEHAEKYVPQMISEAKGFAERYKNAITKAKANNGLTAKNITDMEAALSRRKGDWQAVKAFFTAEETEGDFFRAWVANWQKVADQKKKAEAQAKRLGIRAEDLPALAGLKSDKFENGKVKERLQMTQEALDALVHHEHGHTYLYAEARKDLEYAASKGALARGEIEPYLGKIFRQYKDEPLKSFILHVLPKRVEDWIRNGNDYADLFAKCAEQGITALAKEEFLALSYPKRRAEVVRMNIAYNQRKNPPANPVLALIARQMNQNDWKAARSMLDQAENLQLSLPDSQRLKGLRTQYDLGMKRKRTTGETATQEKTPRQAMDDAYDEMIASLMIFATPAVMKLILRIIEEGGPLELQRLFAFSKGIGNVQWGVDHNWINGQEGVHELRQQAHTDTKRVQEEGHRDKGVENIDVSQTDNAPQQESMFRKYENGQRGVTFYHFGNDGEDRRKVIKDMDERGSNFSHNYWWDLMPKDATLSQIANMCQFVLPKVKKYCKAKQKVLGETSGSQVVRAKQAPDSSAGAADPQFAMAA